MIASVSGIRGVLNRDMTLSDVSRFTQNFAFAAGSAEVLVARDPRKTGPVIGKAVVAALLAQGASALDFGVISTPALFRESRVRRKPAIMVTASHNEPEFNGLKFMSDGFGITGETFDRVTAREVATASAFGVGRLKRESRSRYVDDLVDRFGDNSCEGVKVALDLGGGAAVSHAGQLLRRLGCQTVSINDACGVFNRKMDPVADPLIALRKLVVGRRCEVGLAFDCDGDRLVIVDDRGVKRPGDFMLSLALSQILPDSKEKKVVVSLDTTQAVDEVAAKSGASVLRSKVGEANVVSLMKSSETRLGGEGSSGGLIDGSFNYCRDSLLAALVIISAIKRKKTKVYGEVKSYPVERVALQLERVKALRAIKALAKKYSDADTRDGVKIKLSKRSWVLVRPSGTEDVVRVSAEAETAAKAAKIAKSFSAKMKELSR